jgi:glycosyltransferase involved in cell wall biosynthesis
MVPISAPLASVLIPTHNRLPLLKPALQSVYSQDYPNCEVLVLDDGSQDGTSDYIRSHHPDIRLFRHEESRGQIIGRNILSREAKGGYLINLDDDAYFLNTDAISNVVARMEAEPELAILNFRVLDAETRAPFFPDAEYYTSIFWALGYCVRKAVLEETGYYREIRTRLIGEEPDLALRVLDKGYRLMQFPHATVVHPRFAPGRMPPGSPGYRDPAQTWLFSTKTRLLHAWLNEPFPWWIFSTANVLVKYTAGAARQGCAGAVIMGFWQAVRDFPQFRATRRPVSSKAMRLYLALARSRVSDASKIRALYKSPPGILVTLFGRAS